MQIQKKNVERFEENETNMQVFFFFFFFFFFLSK